MRNSNGVLVTDDFTWWRLIIWLVLLLNLLGKLDCEEKLLLERVPDYATYRQRTKRLIPFVLGIGILFADQCAITAVEPRLQDKDRICYELATTWIGMLRSVALHALLVRPYDAYGRECGQSQPCLVVGAIVFLAG